MAVFRSTKIEILNKEQITVVFLWENIDVEQLIQDVVSTAKNITEKNGNKLKLVLGENLGNMYADVPKVRQVLINLLGNAAKFTEDGVISLSVEKVKNQKLKNDKNQDSGLLNNEENYIVFRVIDTGIGTREKELKNIFQPFTEPDTYTLRYLNTGLGLAICKSLCERMGAEITVKSESLKGSMFTVWFPENVLI